MRPELDWFATLRLMMDLRSFTNIWYWLALAVVWSSSSHFVLGVPYDLLQRARRHGGQAERDFEDMVRINVNRIQEIEARSGALLLGFVSFLLTTLALLGFVYDVEFAQAMFLIGAPWTPVGFLTIATARRIAREAPTGEALQRRILATRIWIQVIGMAAIFVAAGWGVYRNLIMLLPLN